MYGATWQLVIGGIFSSRWCVRARCQKKKHARSIVGAADAVTAVLAKHTYIDHEESLRLHSISNTFNGLFGSAMSMDWVQFCFREKGKWFGANLFFALGGIINCLRG
jgi:hypothetical protein